MINTFICILWYIEIFTDSYALKRSAMFSQAVIEKLKYYVYFLQDPRNNEKFYVGKGAEKA